jgi:hypothetical protein
MLKITDAPDDPFEKHKKSPSRNYTDDKIQSIRINVGIDYIEKLVAMCNAKPLIVELGCGQADICGKFVKRCNVIGIECNKISMNAGISRFSGIKYIEGNVESIEPIVCDILIMSEILEHLSDPKTTARKWMKSSKFAMISHPLDESPSSSLSGGEHSWTYNMDDFILWFDRVLYEIIDITKFKMGSYEIISGIGKNMALEKIS